jgi:PAS domain S-box-containing protein
LDTMHSLLKRQLRRHFGDSSSVPEEWRGFVQAVNEAYREFDMDRGMLERSLDLSSQELLQANSEMRAIFQAIPDLLFRMDWEGTILEYAAAGTSDLTRNAKELLGKRIQDVPSTEAAEQFSAALDIVRATKSPAVIEYCLPFDERNNYYEARLIPLLRDQIIAIVRNITDRKRAEDELKDNEELLKSIIQGYPIPTFMIGKDHRVIHWNRALEDFSGLEASAVIGTSRHWRAFYSVERPCMADLLIDEDQEATARRYGEGNGKSAVPDKAYVATQFFPHLGQTGKWLRFTAAAVRDSRGTIVGAIETLEDITDREKAEQVLKESENRYRAIFENTGTATVIIEEDAIISLANAEFEKLTGYTRDEIENKKSWTEFVVEEDLEWMLGQHRLRRADANAALRQYEFRLVDRHCQIKDCLVTIDMIADTRRSIASLLDITERKQAEMELLREKQFAEKLLESLPGIFFLYDSTCHLKRWNKAHETATGFTADELRDWYIPNWHETPEDAAVGMALVKSVLETGVGQAFETTLINKEGHFVPYVISVARLMSPDGPAMMGVGIDITERKRVEEALIQAEEKYRGIFENAIEGIFQTTFDGRIVGVNPAFAHMLGYDSPEDVLNSITDISHQMYANPGHRAQLLSMLTEQSKVFGFETRFYRKDRSIAWVKLNIRTAHDKTGQISYLEGTAEDISGRKTLEARLLQVQKMEAIGTLAGGIAHDFNNILAPIIGYCELALREIPAATPLYNKIEQVLRSGFRAKGLVKQILTFSRKTEQQPRPVQVSLLVKEILKMLRSTLPSTVEMRPNIDRDASDSTIMADPTQIHQVLMNLCTNAAHAMREKGGVLSIALAKVDIDSTPGAEIPDLEAGSYLRLSVSDTGHGMDEEVRQRIFEPYFTTKGPDEGTGLGLAVVYGIVKDLSGGITVSSKQGEGTTFEVFFPITETRESASVAVFGRLPTGNGRILVVDDEKSVVKMLEEMLEHLGYEVVARYSGADALGAFHAQPERFDLVITDQTMPHMTGTDLAKEILKVRPEIPIVLCTGFSAMIDEVRARKIGIKVLLMKPLALQQLAEEVHKLLKQE